MRKIPDKMRAEIAQDPYMQKCARAHEGGCDGRITWEHAWIYASSQINEPWAILPLCVWHHLGKDLNKHLNQFLSLRRASDEDLMKYPKKDWSQEWSFLSNKFKDYVHSKN